MIKVFKKSFIFSALNNVSPTDDAHPKHHMRAFLFRLGAYVFYHKCNNNLFGVFNAI